MEVGDEATGLLRFGVTKRKLPKSAIAVGIAEMNLIGFLPFSIIDDVGFRRFVDLLSDVGK